MIAELATAVNATIIIHRRVVILENRTGVTLHWDSNLTSSPIAMGHIAGTAFARKRLKCARSWWMRWIATTTGEANARNLPGRTLSAKRMVGANSSSVAKRMRT